MLKLSKLLGTSLRGFSSQAGMPIAKKYFEADGTLRKKVFAPYTIYKGKASLSVEPRLPTFSKLNSGALKVERKGSIMLTFLPAVGERKYDWEKKQMFALSATEVGTLLNLGPSDSCEFFHDPSMLQSNAGEVRKTLSVKALGDGSGYFMSLSVVNNAHKTNDRLTVPVTGAEFSVMRTAFNFALPHIMGWDQYTNLQQTNTSELPSGNVAQFAKSEWER
ncbi:single-stranded DNA-binding protein WHY2, mitochondrial [Ipomoea triloba]|uniref:single-stranded DNA-binding protein WHY2, mitochondrial n=1 Tax=Ipomoea triloba TaxID=35885 RepID=UPI00125E224A|nr:single-stranded DNA-binding protein WHY2, mitochondrial [Ipomoea triloba]GMD63871.1 single-stranded DNA-bindig protein WHY2, mitochondrial isoform X2 [Ipomoea batatas]GMD70847.1 single-stranded DNA-bindig protein WHY2, mitochondrial isoform X2 [Ipomoea batatas]